MKRKIEEIIDRNTEGNYLLSSTDKAQMVSEILDLFGVSESVSELYGGSCVDCRNFPIMPDEDPRKCDGCRIVCVPSKFKKRV